MTVNNRIYKLFILLSGNNSLTFIVSQEYYNEILEQIKNPASTFIEIIGNCDSFDRAEHQAFVYKESILALQIVEY